MTIKLPRYLVLLTLALALLITACGSASRFAELRNDEPSLFYLHVPEDYSDGQKWPLFIVLHDVEEDSRDCIAQWSEIAEENQFFLLCPELDTRGEGVDRAANERLLADILNELYQDFSMRDRFFLVGTGQAANFVLGYADRYPQAIEGISAINASDYPPASAGFSFPILIIVQQGDEEALGAGESYIAELGGSGSQTRLIEIDNLDGRLPYGVQRLTVDLFQQVSR